MRPLKCYVLSLRCLWHGHEAVLGTVYSTLLGRRRECLCCKHCHKVL